MHQIETLGKTNGHCLLQNLGKVGGAETGLMLGQSVFIQAVAAVRIPVTKRRGGGNEDIDQRRGKLGVYRMVKRGLALSGTKIKGAATLGGKYLLHDGKESHPYPGS